MGSNWPKAQCSYLSTRFFLIWTDPTLIDLVTQAMKQGYNNFCTHGKGVYANSWVSLRNGVNYMEEVTITQQLKLRTVGCHTGYYSASLQPFIGHGDEVIVFKRHTIVYWAAMKSMEGFLYLFSVKHSVSRLDWTGNSFQILQTKNGHLNTS